MNKTDADGVVGALVKMERTRMECRFETGERVVFFLGKPQKIAKFLKKTMSATN